HMVVVAVHTPSRVVVIAETTTRCQSRRTDNHYSTSRLTFALYGPYEIISDSSSPNSFPTSMIGRRRWGWTTSNAFAVWLMRPSSVGSLTSFAGWRHPIP